MCPTANCSALLVLQSANPQQFVKSAQLSIGSFAYDLQTEQLVEAYQTPRCYQERIALENLQELMQHPFTTARLNVSVKQGKRTTSLQYAVQINTDEITDVFKNQQAYLYQYGEDLGYQIMFEYDFEALNTVLQTIDMLTYDYVEQKLTGSILTSEGMSNLFISQTVERFNQSETSITFSCYNRQGAQQQTCFQMIANDYGAVFSVPIYNLYLSFYKGDTLIFVLKAPDCGSRYTCWKYGVAVLQKTGLRLELSSNGFCDYFDRLFDFSFVPTTLYIQNKSKVLQVVPFIFHIKYSTNMSKFWWSCEQINCQQLNVNQTFIFEYYQYVFINRIIVTKVIDQRNTIFQHRFNYLTVLGLIILLVLIIALYFLNIRSHQFISSYSGGITRKISSDEKMLMQLRLKVLKSRKIE
ncbi:Hypothetical_protein [Hexamita inflata]|uniref:Hypothetical_protein n=1 Tax=Hexamita inflata TaxID=28002 RepID=A0AA86TTP6_9EUKA|nr:Hypothetical protein HINF_LOCUS14207 [Hexamita inflata]